MKKVVFLSVCFILSCLFLSACKTIQNPSMIKSERRLEKYIQPVQTQHKGGVVDLSEGPKLKYEARFGPKDLNFDIKIVDPY